MHIHKPNERHQTMHLPAGGGVCAQGKQQRVEQVTAQAQFLRVHFAPDLALLVFTRAQRNANPSRSLNTQHRLTNLKMDDDTWSDEKSSKIL